MRLVIQRVSHASVDVEGTRIATIGQGLLVLVGIEDADSSEDVAWLLKKMTQMRIFSDAEGKMNASVQDVNGEILVVSQFTLFASTKKGNRPSFIRASRPEHAIPLYESLITGLEEQMPGRIAHGQFGADMAVSLCNDGPVTIIIDSQQRE
jgi:D-tyrosyl-tRNA(Tyr) deacylase